MAQRKMTQKLFTCHRRMFHLKMKRKILCRFSVLHKYLSSFWYQFLAFWITKSIKYRQLPRTIPVSAAQSPPQPADGRRSTSEIDLVSLKICLLGDNQTGKTSFLVSFTVLTKIFVFKFLLNSDSDFAMH